MPDETPEPEPVVRADGDEPPPDRRRHAPLRVLREMADANPGQWVTLDCKKGRQASSRAQVVRRYGYEATARGNTLWVRKPTSSAE